MKQRKGLGNPTARQRAEYKKTERLVKSAFKSARKIIAKDVARQKPHTTHYACKEVMDKYGDKAAGCCCTGHECKRQRAGLERREE